MRKTILIAAFLLALTIGTAAAGEIKEIELTDGSVITGEVLSLANGVYTVRTESLGTVRIDEARVRCLRPRGSATSAGKTGQARDLEERMRTDKEVMVMIESLKDDPQFRQILEDPEVLKAVGSGDLSALMANPIFLQLMQHRTVQDINRKMAK